MGMRSYGRKSRSNRRRWWVALIILLVLGALAGGEWAASTTIRSKLEALVSRKLDARLTIGRLLYVPPYGAWAWDMHLVRDGRDLISANRVKLDLAGAPWGKGPIIFSRLAIDRPMLNVRPGAFVGLTREEARSQAPRKLSELLRLDHVRLSDARLEYVSAAHLDVPCVWDGLSLDMDLSQQSPAKYQFHFTSQAGSSADADAAGTIDVDTLQLDLPNVAVDARIEPDPSQSPLPAIAQALLKKYDARGLVSLSGSASVPLRDPTSGSITAAVALSDASLSIPTRGKPFLVKGARGRISIDKQPDGLIHARLAAVQLASDDNSMQIDQGRVTVDPTKKTWAVMDVKGKAQFNPPSMAPPRPAIYDGAEPVLPPPRDSNAFQRLAVGGRFEFTATASGPLDIRGKNPWQAIKHEIIAYPRDASFQPKNFYHRIDHINGGEIRLVNGVIIFQELNGDYGGDNLRLRAARLPVEGLPKVQHWQEISGVATFHPPIWKYTPRLDRVLEALNPAGPFVVAGSWTNDRTGKFVKRDYDLIVSSDTGSFTIGPRQVAFSNITGDATVVPAGIDMHNVKAGVLGGMIEVSGHWLSGKRYDPSSPSRYEADVTVRAADLSRLEHRFAPNSAHPMTGLVYADGTISGATARPWSRQRKLATLNGDGQVEIVNGDLFQVPGLQQIASTIGLKDGATMSDAAAMFTIDNGLVTLKNGAISSPMLGLQGGGTIDLVENKLDLQVVAAPLADWRANLKAMKVPVLSDVVAEVAGAVQKLLNSATGTLLYAFRIDGPANEAKVQTIPAPAISDAMAFVFGKMLNSEQYDQPKMLDTLRRGQPPASQASPQPRAQIAGDRQAARP
jgi:hypothetical protein